jgi:hypothetical protein
MIDKGVKLATQIEPQQPWRYRGAIGRCQYLDFTSPFGSTADMATPDAGLLSVENGPGTDIGRRNPIYLIYRD